MWLTHIQKSELLCILDVEYVIWKPEHIFVKNELANQTQILHQRLYIVTGLRWMCQISYVDGLLVW
jgi:hypothetical protein